MCGRYALVDWSALATRFGVDVPVDHLNDEALAPRYNIAPTQMVFIIPNEPRRRLALARWGLIPSWADDPSIGLRLINARAETLAEKPSFKTSYQRFRCLVPADGFYEWKRVGKKKRPVLFRLRDGGPFAFAGLYARWRNGDGATVTTCAIVTTEPNDLVSTYHGRMPVLIAPDEWPRWLDPRPCPSASLRDLLRPFPGDAMTAIEVSALVNDASHEGPRCWEPPSSGTLFRPERVSTTD